MKKHIQRKQNLDNLDKNKNVSANDAKALKPEMPETSLPPLQMKDWHQKWDNYMCASSWGQGENHKSQLAYLHNVVSDKIRTAINFDGIRTMPNALCKIKEYLNIAFTPLTLQRLEMLR